LALRTVTAYANNRPFNWGFYFYVVGANGDQEFKREGRRELMESSGNHYFLLWTNYHTHIIGGQAKPGRAKKNNIALSYKRVGNGSKMHFHSSKKKLSFFYHSRP
jgi:hypothetical protein